MPKVKVTTVESVTHKFEFDWDGEGDVKKAAEEYFVNNGPMDEWLYGIDDREHIECVVTDE